MKQRDKNKKNKCFLFFHQWNKWQVIRNFVTFHWDGTEDIAVLNKKQKRICGRCGKLVYRKKVA